MPVAWKQNHSDDLLVRRPTPRGLVGLRTNTIRPERRCSFRRSPGRSVWRMRHCKDPAPVPDVYSFAASIYTKEARYAR